VGLFVASGPDTGKATFRVDNGEWKTEELFTVWSPHLHLPWAKMLASELSRGDHVLELKVDENAAPQSKGHALRVIYLLVN
jgi:sialidase-1